MTSPKTSSTPNDGCTFVSFSSLFFSYTHYICALNSIQSHRICNRGHNNNVGHYMLSVITTQSCHSLQSQRQKVAKIWKMWKKKMNSAGFHYVETWETQRKCIRRLSSRTRTRYLPVKLLSCCRSTLWQVAKICPWAWRPDPYCDFLSHQHTWSAGTNLLMQL